MVGALNRSGMVANQLVPEVLAPGSMKDVRTVVMYADRLRQGSGQDLVRRVRLAAMRYKRVT